MNKGANRELAEGVMDNISKAQGKRTSYSDVQEANRDFRVFGAITRPRRFPATRLYPVPGATGICLSFKRHFLSRRAKP